MSIDLREHVQTIKGGKYLPVAPRVAHFREKRPDDTIRTGFEEVGGTWLAWAEVVAADGRVLAKAHKEVQPFKAAGGKDASWTKAETGAIGRALSLIGIGTLQAMDLDEGDEIADAPVMKAETVAEHAEKMAGKGNVKARTIDTTNGVVRDITPAGEVVEAEGYTARIGAAHGDPDKLAAILKELATATDINDHRRAHAFANAAERLSGAVGIETAGEVTPTRLEWLAMVLGWTEKALGGDVCAAQRERADAARQDVAVALAAVKAMQGEAVAA